MTMKRISRERRLTPEEAAMFRKVREQVETDLPELVARHHARIAGPDELQEVVPPSGGTLPALKAGLRTKRRRRWQRVKRGKAIPDTESSRGSARRGRGGRRRSACLCSRGAWRLAMPTKRRRRWRCRRNPSRVESRRDVRRHRRSCTSTTSSMTSTFSTPGMKPAPIPWMVCRPGCSFGRPSSG